MGFKIFHDKGVFTWEGTVFDWGMVRAWEGTVLIGTHFDIWYLIGTQIFRLEQNKSFDMDLAMGIHSYLEGASVQDVLHREGHRPHGAQTQVLVVRQQEDYVFLCASSPLPQWGRLLGWGGCLLGQGTARRVKEHQKAGCE